MQEENRSFFLKCRFDSRPEICFIDTGAYQSRLRAHKPFDNYPSLGKTKSKGVSGEIIESDLIRLVSVQAGELNVYQPVVTTLPTAFPHSVLGLEFFEAQSQVTFDFLRKEIRKESFKISCSQNFALKDNLIQIPISTGSDQIFAGWDTGASLNVVNLELAKKRTDLFEFVRDLGDGGDSSGAPVKANLYNMKNMSLCGRTLKDLEFVAVDLTEPKKEMPGFPDLFIGANLMAGHLWSFDFKNRRWHFD